MFKWEMGPWETCVSSGLNTEIEIECNNPGVQKRIARCVSTTNSSETMQDYVCLT